MLRLAISKIIRGIMIIGARALPLFLLKIKLSRVKFPIVKVMEVGADVGLATQM